MCSFITYFFHVTETAVYVQGEKEENHSQKYLKRKEIMYQSIGRNVYEYLHFLTPDGRSGVKLYGREKMLHLFLLTYLVNI